MVCWSRDFRAGSTGVGSRDLRAGSTGVGSNPGRPQAGPGTVLKRHPFYGSGDFYKSTLGYDLLRRFTKRLRRLIVNVKCLFRYKM